MKSLNSIKDDSEWFTDEDIDTTKLTWKEWFTEEFLDRALASLKQKVPELQDYKFEEDIAKQLKVLQQQQLFL